MCHNGVIHELGYGSTSWRVDETYVKVGGRWKYLFRTVDKHGRLIDFMLLERRNIAAAHQASWAAYVIRPVRGSPNHDSKVFFTAAGRGCPVSLDHSRFKK
jgi:hypothetical protein